MMTVHDQPRAARVYFIGAGPGAADLITLRGKRIVESADVILWADSLVNPEILNWARPDADIHTSGGLTLEQQVSILTDAARAGKVVARLHTGDPSVFGAINEQMREMNNAGIGYEVVPGVSSVFAAAAALKTELTQPEAAQTVILTRAAGRTPVPEREDLRHLASHRSTLALFLSAALMDRATRDLLEGGYPPETPAAVVYRASWPDERIVRGTLSDIAKRAAASGIRRQALLLVGEALNADGTRSRLYDPSFSHGWRTGENEARNES